MDRVAGGAARSEFVMKLAWLVFAVLVVAFVLGETALAILVRRWLATRRRVAIEDVLKSVPTLNQAGQAATLQSIAGALGRREKATLGLMEQIERTGLVRSHGRGFLLTESGRQLAMHVLRAHRLMERYLVDEARLSAGRVHWIAQRAEHHFDDEQLSALDAHLGHPRVDPHGDVIPQSGTVAPMAPSCSLTDWPLHVAAQVVHVEDEPAAAMDRVLAARLRPGSRLVVESRDKETVVFRDKHGRQQLSPAVAANVDVRGADASQMVAELPMRLSQLAMDETATVVSLSDQCRGLTRRRLLDLGITPQATIKAELRNAGQSATAYRIRNTLIALRKEQAEQVLVRPDGGASEPGVHKW